MSLFKTSGILFLIITGTMSMAFPSALSTSIFVFEEANRCDYSLESIELGSGNDLSEGVSYDKTQPNFVTLVVKIRWNKIIPPDPNECVNQLSLSLNGKSIMRPENFYHRHADSRGLIIKRVECEFPAHLKPGGTYPLQGTIFFFDTSCDTVQENNNRSFDILLNEVERDLFCRISEESISVKRDEIGYTVQFQFETYMKNFINSNESLDRVPVEFKLIQASDGKVIRIASGEYSIEANDWLQHSFSIKTGEDVRNKRLRLEATIDPENDFRESNERNNTTGIFFKTGDLKK
ncbi:hypothetical protein ACFLT9_04300 [Acidobacteriota bacterium]